MKFLRLFPILIFIYACGGSQATDQMLRVAEGKDMYKRYCANCHQEDGSGLAQLIPPLYESDWLKKRIHDLPHLVFYGNKEPIQVNGITYTLPMPGNKLISEQQYKNLELYVRLHFLHQKEVLDETKH